MSGRKTEPNRTPCVHHTVHCLPGFTCQIGIAPSLYINFTNFTPPACGDWVIDFADLGH